ncbi:MAG: N-acetylmuramoyl-L-alanine amidase [Clostridia bacterium]|jgi:N-acetylmuramoyl-L-alanine amidase|nr:N-acetylmuramoyl-L-alanine amidase [Clostridia bacterium]
MLIIIKKGFVKQILISFIIVIFCLLVYEHISSDKVAAVMARGNTVIVIDAGHGGRDPGAVYGTIYEKNINLDVAKRLQKILKRKDYKVVMTRSKDVNLVNWKDNGSYQRASLWQRAYISKKKNATILVSIHCNSDSRGAFFGPQTFYHPRSGRGRNLAVSIQEELIKVRYTRRKAIPGNYYLLNNTYSTTVIVELGYLSNSKDRNFLSSPEFRQKFAQAIADGICKIY